MVKEFRDENGNLIAYEMSGDDKIKFEVLVTKFDGRMERIESHLQDQNNKMKDQNNKVEEIYKRQSTLIEFLHDLMANFGSEVKKISGADGKPGIEQRLECVEKDFLKFYTEWKTYAAIMVLAMAVIELIFKLWHH
jgi:hypothetical protein